MAWECPVCQAGCAETLLMCQWLCRESDTTGLCGRMQVLQFWTYFLYVGSRSLLGPAIGGPLLWCCSVPFDLANSSLGADFFKYPVPLEGSLHTLWKAAPEASSARLDGVVTDACNPCSQGAWLPWLSVGMA